MTILYEKLDQVLLFHSRSDEDDSLEQVESLNEELTERSRKRLAKVKKAQNVKEVSAKANVDDFLKEAVKEVEDPMPPPKEQP